MSSITEVNLCATFEYPRSNNNLTNPAMASNVKLSKILWTGGEQVCKRCHLQRGWGGINAWGGKMILQA